VAVDLAAIIIASLALVVSIGSAMVAKRSADESRAIELQRRHTERLPVVIAEIEEMNQGQWHRLWLVLKSFEPLDSIRVEILDDIDVLFGDGQTGVEPGVGRTRIATWGKLPVGKREAAWRVAIGKAAPESMRLLLTCAIEGDEWPVQQTVDLPSTYDVSQSVY